MAHKSILLDYPSLFSETRLAHYWAIKAHTMYAHYGPAYPQAHYTYRLSMSALAPARRWLGRREKVCVYILLLKGFMLNFIFFLGANYNRSSRRLHAFLGGGERRLSWVLRRIGEGVDFRHPGGFHWRRRALWNQNVFSG